MRPEIAPAYFAARARESWRTLGYGSIAVPLLLKLHASAPIVAITATCFALPSIWNLIQSQREQNGDKLPEPIPGPAGRQDRREFNSIAFKTLVESWKAELPFEDLVTEAAECSNQFGGRLSVIYVRIPGLPPTMTQLVAKVIRIHIRKTDAVEIFADDEFIICVPLLRDTLAANIVFGRIEGILRPGYARLLDNSCEVYLGKAIYPMDGYTGADLIGRARNACMAVEAISNLV
jgi:hypothetical protein